MGSHYSESEFADPQAPGTFERCKLDWSKTAISPHAEILRLYRDLISLRKQHLSLANCRKDLTEVQFDEQSKWLVMKRSDPSGSGALLVLISPLRRRAFQSRLRPTRGGWCCGQAMRFTAVGLVPVRSNTLGPVSHLSLAGFEAAIFMMLTPSADDRASDLARGCRCLIGLTPVPIECRKAARGPPWHVINFKNRPNIRCFLTSDGF